MTPERNTDTMTLEAPEVSSDLTVVFEDRRVTISPRLSDSVAYSLIWRKRQWPSPSEDQIMLSAYVAFAACRRTGVFDGSFEDFTDAVVAIDVADTPADNAADDGGEPDPTSGDTAVPPQSSPLDLTPAPLTPPAPTGYPAPNPAAYPPPVV